MNQTDRRRYLIRALLAEQPRYRDMGIPLDPEDQRRLLRSLMNVRMPAAAPEEFLAVQDEYLRQAIAEKGVTDAASLTPVEDGIFLWQGDITTLRCDAIVNAANSGMTGCYYPCHNCIDNCIHTYAGIQLRLECARQMDAQGHEEPTGRAKITPAYNLPCRYVLHTVGPIIRSSVRSEDENLLASCYRSCLDVTAAHGLKSVAFCCISTGEFRFPNRRAAEIAIRTVRTWRSKNDSDIEVIFNVFKDADLAIYRELLQ